MTIIELVEYQSKYFDQNTINEKLGFFLWQKYGQNSQYLKIEFPSPKTGKQWRITAQGWVGTIVVNSNFQIKINPKISLHSIFQMLDYAYDFKSFRILEGLTKSDKITGFYNQIAQLLARQIIKRGKQGFYQAYLSRQADLSYLRGRLQITSTICKPWQTQLTCQYDEYTGDILENQILAWTLYIILRSCLCQEEIAGIVRKAYHLLQGITRVVPCTALDCINLKYNRLNQDYRLLHALCRFFLENSVPTHTLDAQTTFPFLVNMASLYEKFVANWLKTNISSDWDIHYQPSIKISSHLTLKPDLVLYNRVTHSPQIILDTKYKIPQPISQQDIYQMVTYAVSQNCSHAVLIYPQQIEPSLQMTIGKINIHSLTFALDSDLDAAGKAFLQGCMALEIKS